jgi:CRP-like cAMP-binding protein
VNDLLEKEAQIDRYIDENDRDAAVKTLFDLIVAYAKKKDFIKAEALRERLYDVDAMALNEIVKSGEIIEEEKSRSVDKDHREIWQDLYDTLSTEEANALFHAMKEASFDTDQTVFKQGGVNATLFLIDEGEAKITYSREGRENLLKTLGPGGLFGEETFFSKTAHCTTEASALSPLKTHTLDKGVLKGWRETFPMLESQLQDYCFKSNRIQDLLKKQDLDRRTQKRIRVKGKLVVQLLDSARKPVGKPFKGSFSDVSLGGLSFFIRITKAETAHLLLGRNLQAKFVFPFQGAKRTFEKSGRIIGIKSHPFGDYSVHVRFADLLKAEVIAELDSGPESAALTEPDIEFKLEE